ncbi:MAG TPA: hypothetical protein VE988_29045 [Gemmataceae bacterium]|nr:hypothetical protein [Gemmataceae bacterium]
MLLTVHATVVIVPRPTPPVAARRWNEVGMTRRVWSLILGAILCPAALSGCGSLFSSRTSDQGINGPQVNDSRVFHPQAGGKGSYSGLEESEPVVIAPPKPVLASVTRQQQPAPGQNIAEFQGPPTVLPGNALPALVPPQRDPVLPAAHAGGGQQTQPLPLPVDKNQPMIAALACLLNKQPSQAIEHLQGFDRSTQEVLLRLLPALALLNEKSIDQMNPAESASLQEQVQALLISLRSRTELTIEKMCLCEQIDGYGQYTPLKEGHVFQPREYVRVYVELRNIANTPRDRYYVTTLNGTVSLQDDKGTPWVHNYRNNEMPILSIEPRSDCYRVYDFVVPALPPGKYTFTLEIVDETRQPRRVAQKSVEFVVAPAVIR